MPSEARIRRLIDQLGPAPGVRVWRAPGRVNVVGEHIDYVGGLVLPFACDLDVLLASAPQPGRIVLTSLDVGGEVDLALGAAAPVAGWGRYVWGVATALREAGIDVRGVRGVVGSNVPVGAGLSSSAAIEAAVALALTSGIAPPPAVLQHAEQLAVGVPCGVMDQVAVLQGRSGHAILLDCANLGYEHVPIPESVAFVVIDTGTRRALTDGRYAARRSEAEAALSTARERLGEGDPRRIAPAAAERAGLPEPLGRRLRHLVHENRRVVQAVAALRDADGRGLGAVLNASHASLRDDFDVSSDALEAAVDAARTAPGCFGARLVGAGFAGCVLAAVDPDASGDFVRSIAEVVPAARSFPVRAVDGAGEVAQV